MCLCPSLLLAPYRFLRRRFLYWQNVLMKCHLRQLAERIDVPELFFTLFEFSFPALSLPHTFIIDFFFFLSSISQHWKLNFWPSLFVTQTCCIGSKKYASTSTKYSIKPWGAPYCLNITRLRGAIYQKIRLITAFPHVVKYLLLYSLQFKSPNECRGHIAKHRVSCKKTTFLNNRKEAAVVASTTPKYSLWHLQFALQKSPQ